MLAQVEAERAPDRTATLSHLLDRWTEVADHELSTQSTNRGYIQRVLKPALGETPLHKLQHIVSISSTASTAISGAAGRSATGPHASTTRPRASTTAHA
jgi:hypothetical protein